MVPLDVYAEAEKYAKDAMRQDSDSDEEIQQ